MTELDTKLRSLTELSPPSRSPLGTDELHQRATRVQRRALAARAVPTAVVVLALLAGAVVLRGRTSSEVTVTAPDTTQQSSLGERDQQLVELLTSAAELRHQLQRETLLTAVYAGSNHGAGEAELLAQRVATDGALDEYRVQVQRIDPARGSIPLGEAMAQAGNRLDRLQTQRTAVDGAQSDGFALVDGYADTITSVGFIATALLQGVEGPALFRGVLGASSFGNFSDLDAATRARLTIVVEVRFYPGDPGNTVNPRASRGACAADAEGAGKACPAFADTLALFNDRDQAEQTFQQFATPQQKLIARKADAGGTHDELLRAAIEDGVGRNDLYGTAPGSLAIDPGEWRASALDRIDRLAAAERQLYALVEAGAPTSETSGGEPSGGASNPSSTNVVEVPGTPPNDGAGAGGPAIVTGDNGNEPGPGTIPGADLSDNWGAGGPSGS